MHTVIGLKPSAGVCPLHYEGRLFESSATLSKPLRRSGGSSHKSCLLFICKITFKQSFNNASVTKIFEAYSSWKMYVHNNNVVQIVLQDTVLFFLWFSKCVFLIMWKCLCSLVKTSSCFNANNLTYTCLFLFSGVPCLFWEGLFLLGGLRKFKPNILFTTCTWLEWPNFLSFYIFQSIQYGDYYLTKITCIFKALVIL